MQRSFERAHNQLRPVTVQRKFTQTAAGSVLISAGDTMILCTASVESSVPPWMKSEDRQQGWVTAEYIMLPGSTEPRKRRDRSGKIDGRSSEIQRLIGRSLRAVVDLSKMPEKTIVLDCDVLQADGGTRTLSITGAYIALVDALQTFVDKDSPEWPLCDSVSAVSVGIVEDEALLDLDYSEDSQAMVDMNVVMTGSGEYIEIQGTGEGAVFDDSQLAELLSLAKLGGSELTQMQEKTLLEK